MISEAAIQGHWDRDWIKAPGFEAGFEAGFEDHTTRVHWMQAGMDYADVRVPLERPDLAGARCLADLDAPTLLSLCKAEGFAGHVTLTGDTCTWHREINWHGTPEAADIGAISFDQDGRMIEAGVLAEYTELWSQKAQAATNATRFAGAGFIGILVMAGDLAVVGIGQTDKPPIAPFLAALETGRVPEDASAQMGGFHGLLRMLDGKGHAVLATNPFAEGTKVLTLGGGLVTWHAAGFGGAQRDIEMRISAPAR